jgi:hypothetical protein
MRNADRTIPVTLGNLRQEIEAEKTFLRYRLREPDPYAVFPRSLQKHKRKRRQVVQLLEYTVNDLWQQLKTIERPFLIRNPFRAEEVHKGDYWGDSDVVEKHSAKPSSPNERTIKNRLGMCEAGLSSDEQRYYRTDLTHRFIW